MHVSFHAWPRSSTAKPAPVYSASMLLHTYARNQPIPAKHGPLQRKPSYCSLHMASLRCQFSNHTNPPCNVIFWQCKLPSLPSIATYVPMQAAPATDTSYLQKIRKLSIACANLHSTITPASSQSDCQQKLHQLVPSRETRAPARKPTPCSCHNSSTPCQPTPHPSSLSLVTPMPTYGYFLMSTAC